MKIFLVALLVSFFAFAEEPTAEQKPVQLASPVQFKNLTINRAEIDADLARINAQASGTRTVPEMRDGKVIGHRKVKLKQESQGTELRN